MKDSVEEVISIPQGSRILIVEDEMIISMEIKQKLTEMGYTVVGQAISGESAIQKAGTVRPDLVLMDIRLKGEMDGITAGKRIIELYDLPIIFLTAHSDKATLERAVAISPSGYLLKPFKERELMTNIEMSLHKHRIRRKVREETLPEGTALIGSEIATLTTPAVIVTANGTIETMNAAATGITGFSTETVAGKPLKILLDAGDQPDSGEETWTGSRLVLPDQVVLKHRDGRMIPVTLSSGLVRSEDDTFHYLILFETGEEELPLSAPGPQMIRYLVALATALRLPIFILDRSFLLSGHNQLFFDLARKAGISQYMLKRPLFETPKFSFFGDMQVFQEIFASGQTEHVIRKCIFEDAVKFIDFTWIPLKKNDVTTHIATIMVDVTSEKMAIFETEKIKKRSSELFNAFDAIQTLSTDLRIPLYELIRRIMDDESSHGGKAVRLAEQVSDLMNRYDTAWVKFSGIKEQYLSEFVTKYLPPEQKESRQ